MARGGVSADWQRTARSLAPSDLIVYAVRLEHPDLAQPARIVNASGDVVADGETFAALRFDLALADDVEGQAPQAELRIANIGRELTQWVDRANAGAAGATAALLEILVDPGRSSRGRGTVEWSTVMDVAACSAGDLVRVRLGYDPMLGQPAVRVRHDPGVSPGLF